MFDHFCVKFSGCSLHPPLLNAICQELLNGITSDLTQTFMLGLHNDVIFLGGLRLKFKVIVTLYYMFLAAKNSYTPMTQLEFKTSL